MGAFGRLYYTPGQDGKVVFDSIVPQMLGDCLPDILIGVVMILVLSASMSTLSSLVIASSSTFTLDFIKGIWIKDMKMCIRDSPYSAGGPNFSDMGTAYRSVFKGGNAQSQRVF